MKDTVIHPSAELAAFATELSSGDLPSDVISRAIVALVNGASSHFVEQDDVHNSSVFHPAAADTAELDTVIPRLWALGEANHVGRLLAGREG